MACNLLPQRGEVLKVNNMPEPIPDHLIDLLALTLVPGMGPKTTAALLARFGSASEIRRAGEDDFRQVPHIGDRLARQFVESLRTLDLQSELAALEEHQVWLLPRNAPDYPQALGQISDAPPLLYCRGTLVPGEHKMIAIVGTRRATAYGRRMTENIAGGLARAGWTIVSGLALGIDTAAHRAALDAGGRTIAVLAGGLSRIYPPQNIDLARQVEHQGCLMTETPMSVMPQPGMFPARNRIISGLCRGVVVVEGDRRSGAMITARTAGEQGRDVFAVPGPADADSSAGCLMLLREGARLVRSADDLLEDLNGIQSPAPVAPPISPAVEPAPALPPPELDDDQRRVWSLLESAPRPIDELIQSTGIAVARMNVILMMLEMKKLVRRLPGNRYERR
jgi:DNA processing protein